MTERAVSTEQPRLRYVALVLGLLTLALGLLALFGWATNTPVLYRVLPSLPPMVPTTALAFVCLGGALASLALTFRAGERLSAGLHLLALVLSAITTVIAVLVLDAYLSGQRFVFADLLFPQAVAQLGTPFGGTPSPSTALNFLFISVALLLLGSGRRALAMLSETLAILALFLSVRTVLGYILGAPELYVVIGETGMALMTSLLFLTLSVGVLLLLSRTGSLGLLRQATTTGRLFRRLIIGMVALLIVALLLQLLNSRTNLFGVGIIVVFLVATSVGLISWIAQSLEEAERGREAAEQAQRANEARLETLANASQTFAAVESDYQALLAQVSRTISAELGDGSSILQVSADGQYLETATHYDSDQEKRELLGAFDSVKISVSGTSPSAQVFSSGHPLLIPVVDSAQLKALLPPEHGALLDQLKLHSLVVVPIRMHGVTIGVLNLYRYRPEQPAYDDGDVLLAQELAARAALAIENAQLLLLEQSQREFAESITAGLERLQSVLVALSGALSVADVANVIVTQGVAALGADAGLVAQLNASADQLMILDSRGYDAAILAEQMYIPLTQPSVLTEAVLKRTPIWLSAIVEQMREYPRLMVLPLSAGFQARAALPLLVNTRVVGVLQLNFLAVRPFDGAERRLLEALALAGAQALDRAQTYDQQQRSLQRLQTLRSIDLSVLAGHPVETIVGRALDDMHAIVPYQYALVALTQAGGAAPQVVAAREWRLGVPNAAPALPFDPAEAVGVFLDTEARYTSDLTTITPRTPRIEYLLANNFRGLFTQPLYADGVRMGQLDLLTAQPATLSEEDQQIISDIGSQIAIVLRQTQLLRERERADERFRLVVEASPSGLVMADTNGRIVLINAHAEQMFGYRREELLGQLVDLLVPPRFRTAHPADRQRFNANPEARAMGAGRDLYGLRKDGSEFPIEIGLNPIETSEGLHILSAVVDITARKQAEQLIQQSEQRLNALFQILPVGVSMLNAEGQVVYTNLALEKIIEMPVNMVLDGTYRQRTYIRPDGMPMEPENFASTRALREQQAVYNVETGIVKEDGAITWVSVNAAPVVFPDWRVVIVITDITERKQSEAALRRSEERFAQAFHASPAAMVITRQSDGVFIDVNQSYQDLVGYRHDELIGQTSTSLDLFTIPGQRAEIVEVMRDSGSLSNRELHLRTKSGAIRTVLCGLESIDIDGVPCNLGSLVDITERKQAEQQLEAYARRLRVLADASRTFAEVGVDYQALLYKIAEATGSVMGEGCTVTLVSDDRQWLKFAVVYDIDPEMRDMLKIIQDDDLTPIDHPSLTGRIVRSEQPLLLSVLGPEQVRATTKPEYWPLLERLNLHSIIGVPMRVQGETIGALVLHRRRPEQPPFDREDLTLAQDLADRSALAIKNVQLFEQVQAELAERERAEAALQRSSTRLQVLADASRTFAEAGVGYRALLDLIAQTLTGSLGEGCVIGLISDDQEWMQPSILYDVDPERRELLPLIIGKTPLRLSQRAAITRIVQTNQPLLLPIVKREQLQAMTQPAYHSLIDRLALHSLLGVPMRVQGLPIGALQFYRIRPEQPPFDKDDLQLAQDLADRAGLAIRNVRLFEQVQAELAERTRAETALRQSEQRFRSYFELGLVGMAIVSPKRYFLDVNDECCAMLGYTRSELLAVKWVDTTHPDDIAADGIELKRVLEGEIDGFSREKRYIHKNGQIVYVIVSVRCLRHSDGSVNYLLVLMQDITERKRAEQSLHEREEQLRLLTETMPAVPWSATPAGNIDYFTQRWLDLTGLTYEQAVDNGWQNIVHPDDVLAMAAAWEHSLATGKPYDVDHRIYTAGGNYRWQRSRALPQYDQAGQIVRWHGITDDIHELRMAEEALRESEARFRQLAERLPQLIWTCLADGLCDYLSPQWTIYTGAPSRMLIGEGWLAQLHPDDRSPTAEAWAEAVATDQEFHREFRIARRDGTYRWFDARAVPIKDISGTTVRWFGSNTDIEERKRDQQSLQRYADQLQRLSRQLVEAQEVERRSIAHELHDQVGQSLTGLKLVLDSTRTLAPARLPQQLEEARNAINELLGRVRNLSLDLRPSMLDDLGLLPALKWQIERYEAQTSIRVHWWHRNIDQRFPALIETSVYRIVQEALTNVARHANINRVEVRIMADDEQLLIQIDDEGRGFDVDATRQSRQSVGLIGMHERVELLGGTFLIDSSPGHGTHLNVTLSLAGVL